MEITLVEHNKEVVARIPVRQHFYREASAKRYNTHLNADHLEVNENF